MTHNNINIRPKKSMIYRIPVTISTDKITITIFFTLILSSLIIGT